VSALVRNDRKPCYGEEGLAKYGISNADACVRAAIDCLYAVSKPARQRPSIKEVREILTRLGMSFRTSEIGRVLREEFPRLPRLGRTVEKPQRKGWHIGSLVHDHAGVYAIYDEQGLQYIGSSERLGARLSSHPHLRSMKNAWLKIRYTRVPGEHLAAEFRLIRRLRPPLNVALL